MKRTQRVKLVEPKGREYPGLLVLGSLFSLITLISLITPMETLAKESFWPVQSIDTMKFSRDLAREKVNDNRFEETINLQVKNIAEAGATHVAIGTPYDDEFTPFLRIWVDAARNNNVNVWFRGNWAGWEGWFGYERISQDEHLRKTRRFILENRDIFTDGDIFTTCPECENGGPGDPRNTKDVAGYRQFLIEEHQASKEAFKEIGKDVASNYFSMNGDVAYLIMDKKTTKALGGIVVVDHYVESPEELAEDISKLVERSGGRVVLGEFGVPIPDIHGYMTEKEQGEWIDAALTELVKVEGLSGINYWTGFGGSTGIWSIDGREKSAVNVLSSYYSPRKFSGRVVNELGQGVRGASVSTGARTVETDKGAFNISIVPSVDTVVINAKGYDQKILEVKDLSSSTEIAIIKTNENIFFKLAKIIYNLMRRWWF